MPLSGSWLQDRRLFPGLQMGVSIWAKRSPPQGLGGMARLAPHPLAAFGIHFIPSQALAQLFA